MAEREKRNKKPLYEEDNNPAGVPVKILVAIAFIACAVLSLYLAIAEPAEGTAMIVVRDIIRGISGYCPWLLSLIFVWIGILFIGSSNGKRVRVFNVVAYSIAFLAIFSAVHVFFVETIKSNGMMNVNSYWQFLAVSYESKIGGGLLGAFMAYYLYEYLGSIAGCGVCVLIVLLTLVATGMAFKAFNWGKEKADETRRSRNEREMRRKRENDNMFAGYPEEVDKRRRMENRQGKPDDGVGLRRETGRNKPIRVRERVSDPNRKSVYIPNRDDVDPDRRRDVTQAFYNTDETGQKKKQRKKIEVPKTLAELKEEQKKGGKKSRFADPDSKRRPVKPGNEADKQDTNEEVSVSADAMAVVAEQAKKENTKETVHSPASNADFHEEIDDIFEVHDDIPEESAENVFVPEKPRRQPEKKRVLEGTRGLDEGISREKGRNDASELFVETNDLEYNYPPIDLLERGERADLLRSHEATDREKASTLIATLESFGIRTSLTGIAHGPAVTRFELQPEPGIKVSRITSLADDIALALAAMSVRIEAPIPGKSAVGVEIPNDKIEMVRIRDVLESNEALHNPSKIAVALGKDNSGRYVVADIAKMPHVLIAGQTGSGKSVCINSIITSILYRATPEDVRMILIDPKVVELSIYNDIPHLIAPVVTEPKKAASALQWAVTEMLGRYKKFSERSVRNIKGYNSVLKKGEPRMPQIVIIIDELADLMMASPGEVEDSIQRLAQLARAAGMHLVIATQRPSVNVITGVIKANIPSRIAFSVASQTDSRVMIDRAGAEKLLGNGDMLFVPNGGKSIRVQGTWVSDDEVNSIVNYIKERCDTNYDEDVQEHIENSVRSDAEIEESHQEMDDKLAEAIEIVVEAGQASVSMLQRRMRVGYARAGRLIDEMEKRGIVSEADGAKPRTVLMTREQFREMFPQ